MKLCFHSSRTECDYTFSSQQRELLAQHGNITVFSISPDTLGAVLMRAELKAAVQPRPSWIENSSGHWNDFLFSPQGASFCSKILLGNNWLTYEEIVFPWSIFMQIHISAFLPEIRWADWHHFHICLDQAGPGDGHQLGIKTGNKAETAFPAQFANDTH